MIVGYDVLPEKKLSVSEFRLYPEPNLLVDDGAQCSLLNSD